MQIIHHGGERHWEGKAFCLRTEHNLTPARTWTRTARSGVEHTTHEATRPYNFPHNEIYRTQIITVSRSSWENNSISTDSAWLQCHRVQIVKVISSIRLRPVFLFFEIPWEERKTSERDVQATNAMPRIARASEDILRSHANDWSLVLRSPMRSSPRISEQKRDCSQSTLVSTLGCLISLS